MNTSTDVYDDLDDFVLSTEQSTINTEKDELLKENIKLKEIIDTQTEQIDQLKKVNESLKRNISSLFRTARQISTRKHKTITMLQSELENMKFRRGNNCQYFNKRPSDFEEFNNFNSKRFKYDENTDEQVSSRFEKAFESEYNENTNEQVNSEFENVFVNEYKTENISESDCRTSGISKNSNEHIEYENKFKLCKLNSEEFNVDSSRLQNVDRKLSQVDNIYQRRKRLEMLPQQQNCNIKLNQSEKIEAYPPQTDTKVGSDEISSPQLESFNRNSPQIDDSVNDEKLSHEQRRHINDNRYVKSSRNYDNIGRNSPKDCIENNDKFHRSKSRNRLRERDNSNEFREDYDRSKYRSRNYKRSKSSNRYPQLHDRKQNQRNLYDDDRKFRDNRRYSPVDDRNYRGNNYRNNYELRKNDDYQESWETHRFEERKGPKTPPIEEHPFKYCNLDSKYNRPETYGDHKRAKNLKNELNVDFDSKNAKHRTKTPEFERITDRRSRIDHHGDSKRRRSRTPEFNSKYRNKTPDRFTERKSRIDGDSDRRASRTSSKTSSIDSDNRKRVRSNSRFKVHKNIDDHELSNNFSEIYKQIIPQDSTENEKSKMETRKIDLDSYRKRKHENLYSGIESFVENTMLDLMEKNKCKNKDTKVKSESNSQTTQNSSSSEYHTEKNCFLNESETNIELHSENIQKEAEIKKIIYDDQDFKEIIDNVEGYNIEKSPEKKNFKMSTVVQSSDTQTGENSLPIADNSGEIMEELNPISTEIIVISDQVTSSEKIKVSHNTVSIKEDSDNVLNELPLKNITERHVLPEQPIEINSQTTLHTDNNTSMLGYTRISSDNIDVSTTDEQVISTSSEKEHLRIPSDILTNNDEHVSSSSSELMDDKKTGIIEDELNLKTDENYADNNEEVHKESNVQRTVDDKGVQNDSAIKKYDQIDLENENKTKRLEDNSTTDIRRNKYKKNPRKSLENITKELRNREQVDNKKEMENELKINMEHIISNENECQFRSKASQKLYPNASDENILDECSKIDLQEVQNSSNTSKKRCMDGYKRTVKKVTPKRVANKTESLDVVLKEKSIETKNKFVGNIDKNSSIPQTSTTKDLNEESIDIKNETIRNIDQISSPIPQTSTTKDLDEESIENKSKSVANIDHKSSPISQTSTTKDLDEESIENKSKPVLNIDKENCSILQTSETKDLNESIESVQNIVDKENSPIPQTPKTKDLDEELAKLFETPVKHVKQKTNSKENETKRDVDKDNIKKSSTKRKISRKSIENERTCPITDLNKEVTKPVEVSPELAHKNSDYKSLNKEKVPNSSEISILKKSPNDIIEKSRTKRKVSRKLVDENECKFRLTDLNKEVTNPVEISPEIANKNSHCESLNKETASNSNEKTTKTSPNDIIEKSRTKRKVSRKLVDENECKFRLTDLNKEVTNPVEISPEIANKNSHCESLNKETASNSNEKTTKTSPNNIIEKSSTNRKVSRKSVDENESKFPITDSNKEVTNPVEITPEIANKNNHCESLNKETTSNSTEKITKNSPNDKLEKSRAKRKVSRKSIENESKHPVTDLNKKDSPQIVNKNSDCKSLNKETAPNSIETKTSKKSTSNDKSVQGSNPMSLDEFTFLIDASISVMNGEVSNNTTETPRRKSFDENVEILKTNLMNEMEIVNNGAIVSSSSSSPIIVEKDPSVNKTSENVSSPNHELVTLKNKHSVYNREVINENKIRIVVKRNRRK